MKPDTVDRLGNQVTASIRALGYSGITNDELNDYNKCKDCILYAFRYIGINITKVDAVKNVLDVLRYPGPNNNLGTGISNHLKLSLIWLSELICMAREVSTFKISTLAAYELDSIRGPNSQNKNRNDKLVIEDIVRFVGARDSIAIDSKKCKDYNSQEITVFNHDYYFILGYLYRYMMSKDFTSNFEREKQAVFVYSEYLLKYYLSQFIECLEKERSDLKKFSPEAIIELEEQARSLSTLEVDLKRKNDQIMEDVKQLTATSEYIIASIDESKIALSAINEDFTNNNARLNNLNDHWMKIQEQMNKNKDAIQHYTTVSHNINDFQTKISEMRKNNEVTNRSISNTSMENDNLKRLVNDVYMAHRRLVKSQSNTESDQVQRFFSGKFLVNSLDSAEAQALLSSIVAFKNYLTNEIEQVNQKNDDLKRRSNETENEIRRYSEQCEDLRNRLATIDQSHLIEKTDLNKKLDAIRADTAILENKISFVQQLREKSQDEYRALESAKQATIKTLVEDIHSDHKMFSKSLNELKQKGDFFYNTCITTMNEWNGTLRGSIDRRLNNVWHSIYNSIKGEDATELPLTYSASSHLLHTPTNRIIDYSERRSSITRENVFSEVENYSDLLGGKQSSFSRMVQKLFTVWED